METVTDTQSTEEKTKRTEDRSLAALLRNDESMLINAGTAEILGITSPVGYDLARIKQGQALLEAAKTLVQKREIEWGQKIAATDSAHGIRDQFELLYLPCVGYAKIAHENTPEAFVALGLNEGRKKTDDQFIAQAENFLAKLISSPDYINPMDEFGISDATVKSMNECLKELKAAVAKQMSEEGDSQTATLNRDEAVEKFFKWTRRYKKVVKIALIPHPRLLVKLGL